MGSFKSFRGRNPSLGVHKPEGRRRPPGLFRSFKVLIRHDGPPDGVKYGPISFVRVGTRTCLGDSSLVTAISMPRSMNEAGHTDLVGHKAGDDAQRGIEPEFHFRQGISNRQETAGLAV